MTLWLAAIGPSAGCSAPPPAAATVGWLKRVTGWAYQLQGLERPGAVAALAAAPVDLLVVEPTRTVRGMADFPTAAVVRRLQDHGKRVLAYINIGQAEDYRTYWTEAWRAPTATEPGQPPFVLAVDPDGWAGNFPVAYWQPDWQRQLFGGPTALIDLALADGFDGVYLDWVLGYGDPSVVAAAAADGVDPAAAMVDLLARLRGYARQHDPEFVVVAQNAAPLLELDRRFAAVVDGVAQEDLSFRGRAGAEWDDDGTGDIAVDPAWQAELLRMLGACRDSGLPVLTVDYARRADNVAAAVARSRAHGFVPLVTRVALDRVPAAPRR